MTTTLVYKMPAHCVVSSLAARKYLPAYASVLASIMALIAMAIILDFRWAIVALMLVFLVLPALMAVAFLSAMLKPSVCLNILPHTLDLHPEGIVMTVCPKQGDLPKTFLKRYNDLSNIEVGVNSIKIRHKTDNGFIYLCERAFLSRQDFLAFVDTLTNKLPDHSTKKQPSLQP